MFLQELEELLISPPPPAAIRLHTGHKRKGTASAQHAVPSTSEENSPISIPNQNLKKLLYSIAVPSTREGNSPIPLPLDLVPPGILALQLLVKNNGTLPTNPTDYFNFVADTCWRANTLVLMVQLLEMYNRKQVKEGHKQTAGHSYWFSDNPEWLILAWVTAGVQISNNHIVQKKMLTTLWTKRLADVLVKETSRRTSYMQLCSTSANSAKLRLV